MKAIIPVAGVGTKLRPHTHTQPKPLMPVAGKPILGHIIDSLLAEGINNQVFVLGYLGEKIREYVQTQYGDKVNAEFVVQEPRRGLAHAVALCKPFIADNEEIIIILGDTIFGKDIHHILKLGDNILGVQEVNDPRKFGVAVLEEAKSRVLKVVEKPQIPTSNLALVGLYKINEVGLLFQCIDKIMQFPPTDHTGQYLLTDAIMEMIQAGLIFQTYKVENWYDCGSREALLYSNRILLEKIQEFPQFPFENTVILPPVHIAENCKIKNSIIGPYVAIAENTEISNSIIRNSIVGAYSQLETIILNNSVLGNDTTLKGKAHSVNIGDSTEIDFDE